MENVESTTERDPKQLIDLLEFEIDRITEQQKQPGWTNWALFAAAAALLWKGASLFEAGPHVDLLRTGYLFLMLALTYDFIRVVGPVLTPDVPVPPGSRFRLASDLIGRSRPRIMYQIIRFCGLAVLAWYVLDPQFTWANRAALLFCGFMAVTALATIAMSFAELPISISPTPPIKVRLIGGGIAATVLAVALFGLVSRLFGNVKPSITEWKLAGICFGLSIIVDLLLSGKQHVPLLEVFLDLRRKLALSEIDYEGARTQFHIAIRGLAVEHILQRHIDTILGKLRSCVGEHRAGLSELGALKNQFERNPQIPTAERKALFEAVSKSVVQRLKNANDELRVADVEVDALTQRVRWLRRSSASANSDIDQVLTDLKSATSASRADVAKYGDEIDTLCKWFEDQQNIPPPA
jgi:hypothetical protein